MGMEEIVVMAMPVEAEPVTVSLRPPRRVHFENSLPEGLQDQVEFFNIDDACNLDRAVKGSGATSSRASRLVKPDVATCLLYTSPSPRDKRQSRMPSSA